MRVIVQATSAKRIEEAWPAIEKMAAGQPIERIGNRFVAFEIPTPEGVPPNFIRNEKVSRYLRMIVSTVGDANG